jgi:glycosyltransferase involved in cell wall biosynthesis
VKHGRTAAYTILKNERNYIEKWLYYAKDYDYRVLLDTGSTDGSWELLEEAAKKDKNLIIQQKTFTPWRFDVARIYNLSMVPNDVVWALSPDLDEYYSINTLDEMERIIDAVPDITCIASDRLDIYSATVRVGPPNFLPTNKIHRRHDYSWKARIYEHLTWIHKDRPEKELYSEDIFLVHDQDFRKPERQDLYVKLMEEEWNEDPKNSWNNWFLLYYYYKSGQFDKYLPVACNYVLYHNRRDEKNWEFVYKDLISIQQHKLVTPEQGELLRDTLDYMRTIKI